MKTETRIRTRRTWMGGLAACALTALAVFSGPVAAQGTAYPNRPIKVIVPFGPGSATDIMTRLVTDEMRLTLGQSFVVENRAGANGFLGAEAVAKAAPDGYTLLGTASTTHAINPNLFKKLPYDPVKEFTPLGGINRAYYFVAVNNDVPVKTLSELIAYLKAKPGTVNYGWGGTVGQLATTGFLDRIGAKANGVPYKSSPQAITDLIGGQIEFMLQDVPTGVPHVKARRMRALAVSSPQRIPDMPDVPTMAEAGLPGFTAEAWVGMYAPAGTPDAVMERLSEALLAATRNPAVVQKMMSCCSVNAFPISRAQFGEYVAKDRAVWAERIKAAGIQPE